MKFIALILSLMSFSSFAEDFYFIGGEYNSLAQTNTPMKLNGLTWMGPTTSTFWETDVSGSLRAAFASQIVSKYDENKIQLLPTHTIRGELKPTQWVSDKHAYASIDTDVRMGAIIRSDVAKNNPEASKIENVELVTLVQNPKNKALKEFSAQVDMKDLNLGSWKAREYGLTKASAKMVDPADLKLPKKVVAALGDEVAKFAKDQKVDSSDLDSKLLVRMKLKNSKGELQTVDYLLSDNNHENLNLLNLRGLINFIGGFNASRTLNDLVGINSDVKVNSTTAVKASTIAESYTIEGSEDKARARSK